MITQIILSIQIAFPPTGPTQTEKEVSAGSFFALLPSDG